MKFITGSKLLPARYISVEVDESFTTVFSSTCLVKLILPAILQEMDDQSFAQILHAAIRNDGIAFNTV